MDVGLASVNHENHTDVWNESVEAWLCDDEAEWTTIAQTPSKELLPSETVSSMLTGTNFMPIQTSFFFGMIQISRGEG